MDLFGLEPSQAQPPNETTSSLSKDPSNWFNSGFSESRGDAESSPTDKARINCATGKKAKRKMARKVSLRFGFTAVGEESNVIVSGMSQGSSATLIYRLRKSTLI